MTCLLKGSDQASTANIDISDKLATALPWFILLVIGLTVLLLMAVFRSILVPIKAAIAILFGLSMDYEVFILSRIREDFVHNGNPRNAVLTGITSSARVITAAALIMVSVFGAFVLGDNPVIKMFGIGLSVAVLLDATVVVPGRGTTGTTTGQQAMEQSGGTPTRISFSTRMRTACGVTTRSWSCHPPSSASCAISC